MSSTRETWQRDTKLPFQKLDEDTLVVDPATRAVHLLNEPATRVWELLGSPRSIDQLVATLTDEYEAPESEIRGAVEALLVELAGKGVLVRS